jgi:hypothetical protein
MKINPALKGLLTAAAMISVILAIYNAGEDAGTKWQFLVYIFYALGIVWTLFAFRRTAKFTGTFGNLFAQGFKCFIVVTLLMALFYGLFNYFNPAFKEIAANAYREALLGGLAKDKNILPTAIDKEVATYKKQYTLKLVSGAIFGYLIIGVGVTAVTSILLTRRK